MSALDDLIAAVEAGEKPLPAPGMLSLLLRYEPLTGKLFWLDRDESWFESMRDCRAWNARYVGKEAFTTSVKGYRAGSLLGRSVYAHRVILAMLQGEWPEIVDHINGNKQDNRAENLRSVSHVENMRNLPIPITNTSGVIGVGFDAKRGKWVASISVNRRSVFLGNYESLREATIARRAAEKALQFQEMHGRAYRSLQEKPE